MARVCRARTLLGFALALGLLGLAAALRTPLRAGPTVAALCAGPAPVTSRRGLAARVLAPAALLVAGPATSRATEWLSGRTPGGKPKDGDPTGTKKDSRYLRCLSNCLPSCIGGPSGVQRERSDCLQQCQDECCQSYEQCSYRAVKSE
ncbi:hypothetical protein T492DRAFT_844789 [Pavlovales sp. CCMP2436]|nr:hypothetical protein T492DRAFT_844789 [Pavlovales sp. CCMP2436]